MSIICFHLYSDNIGDDVYPVAVRPHGNYKGHVSFRGIPASKTKDVTYWTNAYEYQQQIASDSRMAARLQMHDNPDNDTKTIVPDLEPIESDDSHMGSMSPQNQKSRTAKSISSDDDPMGSMSPQNQKKFRGRKSGRARFSYSINEDSAREFRKFQQRNSRGFFANQRSSRNSRGRGGRKGGLSRRRFQSTKPAAFSNVTVNQGDQNIYIYNSNPASKHPLSSATRLYGGIGPAPADAFQTPQTKPPHQIRGAPKPLTKRKSRALKRTE